MPFVSAHPVRESGRDNTAPTAEFKCPSFAAAMGFMTEVAIHADKRTIILNGQMFITVTITPTNA